MRILKFIILPCMLASLNTAEEITTIIETESGTKFENTTSYTWHTDHYVVVRKSYIGAWDYYEMKSGEGSIAVRLYNRSYMIGTLDGVASQEIVFQLPASIKVGETAELKVPAPLFRKKTKTDDDKYTDLKDREIIADIFANPQCGSMKQANKASVRLVSETDKEVEIHLILKANTKPGNLRIDIDTKYVLKKITNK